MTDVETHAAGEIIGFTHDGEGDSCRLWEIREVWECACSGDGHPVGRPNAKCYRKGGQARLNLFEVKTGEWAGWLIDEDERGRLINDYGWQEIDGGFLLKPKFAEVT